MNAQDLACFELWLERFATDAERELTYEEQITAHIYWLADWNEPPSLKYIQFSTYEQETPH